jgi:hypothetical protein
MKCIFTVLITYFTLTGFAQTLLNSSMEGEPQDATMPDAWHACEKGTTPDILPGPWGVQQEAYDGASYVGLITRPDGSWEAIGQQFSQPLELKSCYRMSIIAAHSDTYTGYNRNGRMRVWLGKTKCDKAQLLIDVKSLTHTDWKSYPIEFISEDEYKYIIIESYHPPDALHSKGNILIDKIYAPIICGRV